MKKSPTSNLLFVSLAVLSLASYIYLGNATVDVDLSQQKSAIEMEEQESQKVLLPDVSLVKKLFNITKIVLPRD